jgi:hypothetical protein
MTPAHYGCRWRLESTRELIYDVVEVPICDDRGGVVVGETVGSGTVAGVTVAGGTVAGGVTVVGGTMGSGVQLIDPSIPDA